MEKDAHLLSKNKAKEVTKEEQVKEYLYEKLTEEVFKGEKDFSADKIERYVDLLDIVDPDKNLENVDVQSYLREFYEKNEIKRNKENQNKYTKCNRHYVRRGLIGIAAAFVLLISTDLYARATYNQTVLEFVGDLANGGYIRLIPKQEEPVIGTESEGVTFNSWFDLERATNISFLKPTYIPDEITEVSPIEGFLESTLFFGQMYYTDEGKYFNVTVMQVTEEETVHTSKSNENYKELDSIYILDGKIEVTLLQKEDEYWGIFGYDDILYEIESNFDYETVEKILDNMK